MAVFWVTPEGYSCGTQFSDKRGIRAPLQAALVHQLINTQLPRYLPLVIWIGEQLLKREGPKYQYGN